MNGGPLVGWSNLNGILAERNLSVPELHRKLVEKGFSFNIKTLYRLASSSPLRRLDLNVIQGLSRTLELHGLDELIKLEKPKTELKRLSSEKQERLDELLDKNNAATLKATERKELAELVSQAQTISLHNARMIADQKRGSLKTPIRR